ncbi:MAG: hypothetical protein K8I30_17250, partial [Anaerolineae bacterium]|nr:hypothetical protein [Anaerolineae bacterium]
LNGVEQAERALTDTLDVVRLHHQDGRQTVLAWARTESPVQVQIGATSDKALLLDQYGEVGAALQPENGVYTLNLPGARCNPVDGCAVGGAVSLFIQPDGTAAVFEITSNGQTALVFE